MRILNKVLVAGSILSAVILSFLAGYAEAKVVKMSVALTQTVDPETGERVPVAANPSGEANITHTASGLKVEYVDRAGKPEYILVESDFMTEIPKLEADPERFAKLFQETLRQAGRSAPARILIATAEAMMQIPEGAEADFKPTPLVVLFDRGGRVGFRPVYRVIDLTLFVSDGIVGLETAVYKQVAHVVSEQMEYERQQRAPAEVAPSVPKPSMGFITPADAVVRSCESLFGGR